MFVRDITLNDAPQYRELLACLYQETQAYFAAAPPTFEQVCLRIRHSMLGQEIHLVAEEGDEIVGWIDVTPYQISGMSHCGDLAMGVSERFRGRGLGTLLLRDAIRRSESSTLEFLHLEVFASNSRALALYERHGFSVDGIRRRARKCRFTGDYEDIILMSRACG